MNEEEYIETIKKGKASNEEKIQRVVEMQKFSRDFKKDKDKVIYVWDLI